MAAVCVIGKNGERLMPTKSYGKVRHMLKDGRAVICKRNPFTIQLTYETPNIVEPVEICEDTGYEHIGLSIKSESQEYVSAQYDLLRDEKQQHDACRKYRRSRRGRLRYRKPKFLNRRKDPLEVRDITDRKKKKVKKQLEKFRKYQSRHESDYASEEEKDQEFQRWYNRQSKTTKKVLDELLGVTKPASMDREKAPAWFAPSIRNKAERHVDLIVKYAEVTPVTDIWIEVGEFDIMLLKALQEDKPIPQGTDYQRGPKYQEESLRAAVFHRDGHTCQCCGRSLKDGAILHAHHMYFWRGQHGNSMDELITVCEQCHTPSNHQPEGKLWGLDLNVGHYAAPAFMNTVRWYIVRRVKEELSKRNIDAVVHTTYGAATKGSRIALGLEKSHANDAYAMGSFHPGKRADFEHYQKRRRNDRCLEKFYDAVYIDLSPKDPNEASSDKKSSRKKKKKEDQKKAKDGRPIKTGSELGCNRTKRNIPRNNPQNMRKYRGEKISKGKRSIRKKRYSVPSGSVVVFKNRKITVSGTKNKGTRVAWYVKSFDPEKKKVASVQVSTSIKDVSVVRRPGAWIKIN